MDQSVVLVSQILLLKLISFYMKTTSALLNLVISEQLVYIKTINVKINSISLSKILFFTMLLTSIVLHFISQDSKMNKESN